MTQMPVPESTLRTLYSDHVTPITAPDPREIPDWIGRVPVSERDVWRGVRAIPRSERASATRYTFDYERARFSPFQVDRNFGAAGKLLEECYDLRDAADRLDVEIRDRQAMWRMAEALEALGPDEDAVAREKLSAVAHGRTLSSAPEADGTRTTVVESAVAGGLANPTEVALAQARRAIARDHRLRLQAEAQDAASPYNRSLRLARLRAMYVERFTDLVMMVAAVKHGMWLVHGVTPTQLQAPSGALARAIRDFRDYGTDTTDRPAPEPAPPLEPEHHIREYLWAAGQALQARTLRADDYVEKLSVRHELFTTISHMPAPPPQTLMQQAGGNATRERELWTMLLKAGTLDCRIPSERFDASENPRLIGVSAQLVLDETRGVGKEGTISFVEFKSDEHHGSPVRFAIAPPRQSLAREGGAPFHADREVSFVSPAAMARTSAMMTGASTPVMYGRPLVENFDPAASYWTVRFTHGVNLERVRDIHLFLHVKRWAGPILRP